MYVFPKKVKFLSEPCQKFSVIGLKVLGTGEGPKIFSFFFAYYVVYILLYCYLQNDGSLIASF